MRNKIYSWYVVFINALIGCILSASFPQSSMTIVYLAEKMQVPQEVLLIGDTIKTIGIILAMLVSGFCYKKLGAKRSFILSMATLIPSLVLTPFVPNISLFYLLKFIQGLSSLIFPIFLLIIMGWMDEKNRGLSTALFNGIFYGGAGIGGTFSGFVISRFGWIESYWALGILQLFVAIIWLVTVQEKPSDINSEEGKSGNVSFGKMLLTPVVWLLIIAFISTTWSVQAISIDMPLFGSYLGYGEMETGKILSAITIGIISACVISGKVSDLLAAKMVNKGVARVMVYAVGCIIIIISIVMLVLLDLTNFMTFYFAVLVFSFGSSWGLGTFYSILPELFDGDSLPMATGFIGGCGDIGMTLAPVVVGILFGIRGYWKIGWVVCAVVALFSALACVLIINKIGKQRKVG